MKFLLPITIAITLTAANISYAAPAVGATDIGSPGGVPRPPPSGASAGPQPSGFDHFPHGPHLGPHGHNHSGVPPFGAPPKPSGAPPSGAPPKPSGVPPSGAPPKPSGIPPSKRAEDQPPKPSGIPRGLPSGLPSNLPSGLPIGIPPSGAPSGIPTGFPSGFPSDLPIPSGARPPHPHHPKDSPSPSEQ